MAKEISNLITFNTYKFERGGLLVDMFNQFNARVGDQGTELAIQWETSKTETKINLKERGLHFFGTGSVGQYLEKLEDGTGFKMSADASTVEWEDKDGAGSLDDGITVVKLPKQFFPQKGIFFGYFGLKDSLGNIFTSVNVWFRVLGGVPTMGAAIPYFVTEFDEVLERCNGKIVDALAELREKYQAEVKKNEDMSAETRAALSKLADSVGAIQAQIDAGNVVTLARHIDDYKDLNNKIDNQLAQMDMQVETFENLDAVKTAYPEGKEGIFLLDNGHRAVYRNGQWIDAGVFQASTIKDGDVFNSELKNANYFTDPTFTVDKPFTDDKTALTVKNINGTNWLHVESSTGGGIGLEAHNTNDDLFQIWAKRLQFDLSNHTNQYQSFNVEVQIYNIDDNTTVTKSGIGVINVKPLTAYHANLKFNLPSPGFTNRYYRIFIYSNSANADYDIANPVLRNDYANLPEKNNFIDTTNLLSPIGSVSIGTYYNAGKHYCNITSANSTAENKGAQQTFQLEPYGSGYGDKFRVKTEVRNEGTPGIVIAELRYLNADGSIGSSQLISRTVLATSQSVAIDRIVKLSSTENAKDYRLASLAIYVENSSDAHLLINLDKTSVSYEPNVYKTKDNLFGNWATNHVISDGSTATDYYNDAQVLDVYLAGSADYSTLMLPMSYNSKGMIDIDIKLLSSTEEQLKFELNEYNTDGSIQHINELRQEKLLPGIARTAHITYNVTETDGSYYALVIYSQKRELSFTILDAKAQLHDTSRALEAGSLPQVNLLANLDEGGATAQGKVELIRGNTSHLYYATFKIQGQSTKTFPKKAWRITFYTDDTYKTKLPVRVFPDYPDVDSLNMKSNYIDWTQANNILVSRCIADLTKLSNGIEDKQMYAPNQCEIVGEPCLGYNNGQKLGLFTLSPKKSNVMFNMEKGNTKMAVFEGNNVTEENCFKADSTEFGDDKPFTIEATDDVVDQSLKDSFNALLKLVNSSTDDDFKTQISSKLNLQSVANWIVSIIAFGLYDNTAKNICWATWDGVKWSAVQYDHDMAFGLWWDGSRLNHEESDIDLPYLIKFSRLFERLIKLHLIDDQLISAWDNLKTAHPMIELQKEFRDWYYRIGDVNYEEDQRIWPDMPGQHYFHTEHVLNYIAKRYKHCDKWFTKAYLATL
ncbi:CotH kinase family protein [Limosilactobacillus reuteri]|uniref:CotH kinase family protein n=1 Tax=Limosilactobacillus reuteri TaxID=1598 RepID=UPI002FF398D3